MWAMQLDSGMKECNHANCQNLCEVERILLNEVRKAKVLYYLQV